jgi:hypothetical protein
LRCGSFCYEGFRVFHGAGCAADLKYFWIIAIEPHAQHGGNLAVILAILVLHFEACSTERLFIEWTVKPTPPAGELRCPFPRITDYLWPVFEDDIFLLSYVLVLEVGCQLATEICYCSFVCPKEKKLLAGYKERPEKVYIQKISEAIDVVLGICEAD